MNAFLLFLISALTAVYATDPISLFKTPLLPVLRMAGLGLFLSVGVSWAEQHLARWKGASGSVYVAGTLLTMGTALMLSYVPGPLGAVAAWLVPLLGFLAAWRQISLRKLSWSLLAPWAVISLWIVGSVWVSPFRTPHFLAEVALSSLSTKDTLYHSTISQMFFHYGWPSTGLHGLPYHRYHFGLHWLFARLSHLIDVHPLVMFNLGFPVVLFSLFFHQLFRFILVVRQTNGWPEDDVHRPAFWWAVAVVFIGVVPRRWFENGGFGPGPLTESESYLLAICLTLMLASTVFRWTHPRQGLPRSVPPTPWAVILVAGFVGVITLVKSPVGIVVTLGLSYLAIRLSWPTRRLAWAIVVLTSLALAAGLFAVAPSASHEFLFGAYLRESITSAGRPYFFLVTFFWAGVYAATRLMRNHSPSETWREGFVSRRWLDLELLLLISAFSFTVANLFSLSGPGAFYMLTMQSIAARAALLADPRNLSTLTSWFRSKGPALSSAARPIALLLLGLVGVQSIVPCLNLISERLELRHSWHCELKGDPRRTALFQERCQLLDQLLTFHRRSEPSGERHALFIPKSNRLYWNLQREDLVPFIAPSLSGMASVGGLPVVPIPPSHAYGYDSYPFNAWPTIASQGEACREAERLGFSGLTVLDAPHNRLKITTVRCDES